ncbi:unnamed protein product [Acanthoscelides obtectus]|uniref:LON peptidase N-terminal domain and RING finger protein 3 n=2 Tax=Acanthoscelides obtectus TaxID=200917 RepID=A0A9P0MEG0_ACAOB|nr:unnamed protein product [Acanthoscelides obtectus]CAH2012693.1 unnamed protein product [Acanthoscelides obtectus]CAK1638871.1 LON peptidase N-terminal domain and RING finger protein 1 [Acanthoscelides obtectus]CAK1638909.1 LON peptidase N-terminal domain and RING finger protein 1 [Acanthoscelides obtectus]
MHRVTDGNDFFRKYPELFTSLSSPARLKCEGRVLRKDTERARRIRKYRRQPNYRRKQFEAAFFRTMDQKTELFTCPVCRQILKGAITVECGHTLCGECLERSRNSCKVCEADLEGGKRCVNVLVQDLVEKWRERNRKVQDTGPKVPETVDILGVEPRYHLRSGYAGLQINKAIEDRIMGLLDAGVDRFSKYKHKRILKSSNLSNSYCNGYKWLDEECLRKCDQFEDTLRNVFKEVDYIKDEALKHSWDCISISDLECILCSRCLLDPVTTGCGHTFCRGCLTRVLDHGLSCPLCMASLNVSDYSRGTTEVLQQAIQFLIPDDFSERVSLSIKENLMLERSSDLPVFICINAFPGVACPLYVYEPRYRLLARRCLRSSTKRFAMAGRAPASSGERFAQVGTVLEIKDAISLQDGRFILTTVGMRRFKVLARSEQDGYDTATVQYISDAVTSADKLPELQNLHAKVHAKAFRWIRSLKPRVLAEVERLIGQMPKVEEQWWEKPDGPMWAWWLMPILPLSSQLQIGFLSTTSLEKRLRAIDKMLEHMKIRMRALERNTVTCSEDVDTMDTCSEAERSFELPFTDG